MALRTLQPLYDWIDTTEKSPDPMHLLKEILPAQSAVLVSGRAKLAFKSWLTFAAGMSLASGKKISMIEPANGPMAVACYEEEGAPKPTALRFRWLERGCEIDLQKDLKCSFLWSHMNRVLLDDPKFMEACLADVAENNIKLAIFDTYAKVNRHRENDNSDVSIVMAEIDRIKKAGASVMYLHHISKAQKDFSRDIDDEVRGGSALSGFYDVHWAIRRRFDNDCFNILTCRQRDGEEKSYSIQWNIDKEAGTAKLVMDYYDPDTIKPEELTALAGRLTPGVKYQRKTLRAIWKEIQNDEILETVIVQMEEQEYLVRKGNAFLLNIPTSYEERYDNE